MGPSYLERSVTRSIAMPGGGEEFSGDRNDPRIKAAQQTVERFEYYAAALKDHFDAAEKFWKLYMLIRKDNFKPWEYWRSKIVTAHPNTVIEVSTAHLVSQIFSHTPPMKPESTSTYGREALQQRMENWFDYCFRANQMEREVELFVREMLIQGMVVRKNAYIERSRDIVFFPSPAQAQEFEEKLAVAVNELGATPPVPEDFQEMESFKQAFDDYRAAVNGASGLGLPEFPVAGPRKITHYKGPGWKRISMFNFFFDPSVAVRDQEDMILASVVDESWVRSNANPANPNSPFDPEMVEWALKSGGQQGRADVWDANGRNQWEQRLARAVRASVMSDEKLHPGKKKPAFLLEHYFPGSKIPYRVVLNGVVCINKRKSNPFEHGDFPFTIGTNVNLPFISTGLPDLMPAESLFSETNALRALTSDGVKLSVLPIFARMRETGLTDLAKFLVPGAILDTIRARGALEQVSKISPPDTMRYLAELRSEIEDATGTYPQARGAVGPTSVTATQTERAFQGLALRNQIKLHRLESDLSTLAPQWLSIAHQFLEDEDVGKLNQLLARELTGDYSLEDFFQSVGMDWAFRASRIVANKELQIQSMKDLFTMGVNAFAAMPIPPVSLEKLFLAIAEKIDPTVARAIKMDPAEQQAKQAELAAQAPPQEVQSV